MISLNEIQFFYDGEALNSNVPNELVIYLKENQLVSLNGKSIQFVGIIELSKVYLIYPKNYNFDNTADGFSILFKTLFLFSKSKKNLELPTIIGKNSIGKKIESANFIMLDWLHHGLLKDFKITSKLNGAGKVNWKKTLDRHLPYDSNGSPVYINFETNVNQNQNEARIIQIQKKIISDCDKKFHWMISENYLAPEFHIFSLNEKENDSDIIFLRNYLNNIYCERTLNLIKFMIEYLTFGEFAKKKREFAYGVQAFYTVWEEICHSVFDGDDSLKSLIPQPIYKFNKNINRTLPKNFIGQIPDTLILRGNLLVVIDAKYYNLKTSTPPGWRDLVKQFFYGWSISQNTSYLLRNILLFPGDSFCHLGHVQLELDKKGLSNLGNIECFEVSIYELMKLYSARKKKDYISLILQELSSGQNTSQVAFDIGLDKSN